MVDVNLPQLSRALSHMGAALDELRTAVHGSDPRSVRLQTEDRAVELPLPALIVGVAAVLAMIGLRMREDRREGAGRSDTMMTGAEAQYAGRR